MTTTPDPFATKRTDEIYKIQAATGFLLNAFSQLDFYSHGRQRFFSQQLKFTANRFKQELEKAEQSVVNLNKDEHEMLQQMADSYEMMDTLVEVLLQAGRTLTPESMTLLNDELVGVAGKYGIKLSKP